MSVENSPRKFPMIWRKFQRVIDGKVKKFWVQDLPEDYFELASDYLSTYLLRDEPLCRALELTKNKETVEYARGFWRMCLGQKCCLACFTDGENGKKELVALNCCIRKSVTDKKEEVEGGKFKTVFQVLEHVEDLKNAFQELHIDSYLGAVGLLTLPEYRGYNIGLEVLHSRKMLCAALGLKATLTMFTAPASQRLAEKAGFKDLAAMSYEEIGNRDPSLRIPNIESKTLRHMYLLYE